jgi:glucosamine 6-phosphate synthetase-like amidotransferase/phosphosugar isomerase protein
MCGIFGFTLKKPVRTLQAVKVLGRLEVHQYPDESTPVGGYGAGLAILEPDGGLVHWKVGRAGDESPATQLSKVVDAAEASVLIGHVRMPTPKFMATAKFKEAAQPYVVEREPELVVASVHNGEVENYKELRATLGQAHVFESEKFELVDSEVVPHLFEELLSEKGEMNEALYSLFCALQGSSAIGLLHVEEENAFLHLIYKGKRRGLTVWTNSENEMVFCSRKEPLIQEFSGILRKGKFKEKISIAHTEDAGLKLSFQVRTK